MNTLSEKFIQWSGRTFLTFSFSELWVLFSNGCHGVKPAAVVLLCVVNLVAELQFYTSALSY